MIKRFLTMAALLTLVCCIAVPFAGPAAAIAENTDTIDELPITPYTYSYECLSSVEYNHEPEKVRADIHCTSGPAETGSSYALTVSMDAMKGYYPFIKECTITVYYQGDDSEIYPVVYTASGYGDLGKPFALTARVFGKKSNHTILGATGIVDGWYEKGDN